MNKLSAAFNASSIALLVMSLGMAIGSRSYAAETPTPQDQDADKEFKIADPQLKTMGSITTNEMVRLTEHGAGKPSPDLKKYILTAPKPPIDLGDTHIPLHIRLIEQARRQEVSAIDKAANLASRYLCERPDLQPAQYLEATARQQQFESIACFRAKFDTYQLETHKMLLVNAASFNDLHLPPYTANRVQKENQRYVANGDQSLAQQLEPKKKLLQANENVLRFFEAREGHVHFNGQFVFDDPADIDKFQALVKEINRYQDN